MFDELDYGRLQRHQVFEIDGRHYAISHLWGHAPIHLVGAGLDLDKRAPGQSGAAQASPHGLVQQFLNRNDDHLWALVSNGLKLRILRDNVSLTCQAYVELDLAAMMDGELYSDFRLLWLLCHQSRVESERPEQCWLEKWAQEAREQGARALEHLREGVETAIRALGSGFLAHSGNTALQDRLASGELGAQDYYRQLLCLVYRLIFLFVAEDRDLLLTGEDETARRRYQDYYSTASIRNRDFLEAVRALAFVQQERTLRPVDYRNLGPEELGSVYESLLELHPNLHRESATFELKTAGGSERKTTGSYYTHEALIQDINEMAVELCKVSLWMTTMTPGRPLYFLDHRIRCGNSLLGTTPALVAKGIPDEAFKPIAGDDKNACQTYKAQNKRERESRMGDLFRQGESCWSRLCKLSDAVSRMGGIRDEDITGGCEQATRLRLRRGLR